MPRIKTTRTVTVALFLLRVYLLVPDRSLSGTRQNAALLLDGRMAVAVVNAGNRSIVERTPVRVERNKA